MATQNIKVYKDLMGENEKWAAATRRVLAERRLSMVNLIGSPGSGKTALIEATAKKLGAGFRAAVLEGDVETTRDAERIAAVNLPVSQLLTSGACHLEAKLVYQALLELPTENLRLVIVENVGNMVCPAEFDIGEHAKVAVLSVTEGEDKPLKYPLLFREAKAVVLTKIDLLPHLDFNLAACEGFIQQVHAGVPVFKVSARTGEGLSAWADWLLGV
ncbi:MAG TPA: hydrogenase nickel incorporation protein HypB [Kiritimatiellia bacterium]|nr:hydrogenase nickel incorporation protein HypB [Kiritimatiellia bacterium]HRZ11551.1 hydrogenase nickel incorporation protein HypB [Kiritimatiellia bacterium]HSA16898.1 hydrogenase nickel incorporation protein HypB [Kiritimatiellia bacterium]